MHGGHQDHPHGPSPDASASGHDRAFAIGVGLNLTIVVVQLAGGIFANSIALIADAGHNLSDVMALALAWGASALARRAPSQRRTYGWRKSSILASLANAVVLLLVVGGLAWEAVQRLAAPPPVATWTVAWVAAAAIVINGATALLFRHGREHDLNLRGAFLHMAADAGLSADVVLAAIGIALTGWQWLDPAMSLVISAVITIATWNLLHQSFDLAMDAVPEGIDEAQVSAWLAALPGVTEVHDLHIWAMSTTETALTAHLVRPDSGLDDALLATACRDLRTRFGIHHTTIQVEAGDPAYTCVLAPNSVV
jgi:cobalt-zinc-cadmium efflux system protein